MQRPVDWCKKYFTFHYYNNKKYNSNSKNWPLHLSTSSDQQQNKKKWSETLNRRERVSHPKADIIIEY